MSGLTVKAEQLKGGFITNASVVPTNPLVGANTAYTFTFTPVSSIDSRSEAKIEIELPIQISLTTSSCQIIARSAAFSSQMSCTPSGNKLILSYIFSNKPDYQGGAPLSVTISEIRNADFAGEIGPFTFSTFIKRNNVFYVQD